MVDDSPTELKAMSAALQGKGYNMVTAADGDEALQMAGKLQPDVILLDIVLPKKNGYQVCRQLKSAPETKNIKVVLVSSKNQTADRFWGLKQGADEYLVKPFKPEELAPLVGRYA